MKRGDGDADTARGARKRAQLIRFLAKGPGGGWKRRRADRVLVDGGDRRAVSASLDVNGRLHRVARLCAGHARGQTMPPRQLERSSVGWTARKP